MIAPPGTAGRRGFWHEPIVLVALSDLVYLLYIHVAASVPHAISIFGWLPLGPWVLRGRLFTTLVYALIMAVLFLLYAVLLRSLASRPESPRHRRVVFYGAALFSVTLVFMPRLLSKDLFDYMGHARLMTVHHANPFTVTADSFPPDQFTQAMGWAGATPLYGPAWASIISLLSLLGGDSLIRSVLVYKLFLAVVHLLNGWLVLRIVRGRATGGGAAPHALVGSSRVDLQACKLEYSIVSPK